MICATKPWTFSGMCAFYFIIIRVRYVSSASTRLWNRRQWTYGILILVRTEWFNKLFRGTTTLLHSDHVVELHMAPCQPVAPKALSGVLLPFLVSRIAP